MMVMDALFFKALGFKGIQLYHFSHYFLEVRQAKSCLCSPQWMCSFDPSRARMLVAQIVNRQLSMLGTDNAPAAQLSQNPADNGAALP